MSIKKGQILILTEGVYEGYSVNRLVKTLKDFKLEKVKADWYKLIEVYIRDSDNYTLYVYKNTDKVVRAIDFIDWLINEGYVESLAYVEIHVGDSRQIDIGEMNV